LSTSADDRTYEPGAFDFVSDHCQQLARADEDDHHWPGGSDFADLGADSASQDSPRSRRSARSPNSPLPRLTLAIARDRFRYFEPVELDVRVRWPRTATRPKRIPDALDPGYALFRIWIEEPNGERRLYRSPRKYCFQNIYRTFRPNQTFSRDISIFGQSGGYTFRRAGVHRLWAEFDVDARRTIRSNTLEVDIESARHSRVPTDAARALRQVASAELLYHRLDRRLGVGAETLEQILEAYPKLAAASSVRYALARAYLSDADLANRAGRARAHLTRAIDSTQLGEHQRIKAIACVRALDE
jgi:hypothetical protein